MVVLPAHIEAWTPPGPAHTATRPLDSLRWRLPLLFGALIVVMLGTFMWAMSRSVETTLVRAGQARALVGARQLAELLARPIGARSDETVRLQSDSSLRAALRNPNPLTLEAARRTLLPSSVPVLRRSELWDTGGSLVLEIATAPRDTAAGLQAFPAGSRPTGPMVSAIQAAGRSHYFDIVIEIRDDSARGGQLLGYLRRFGRLTSNAGDPIRRLLGDSASFSIGSRGGLWTNFNEVTNASADSGSPGEGDSPDWVAAAVPVEGSPWTAWVGFPRTMIVAPARSFMRQMVTLALFFLGAGVALALLLGMRLTRPLHELALASEQIAAGDFTRRVTTGRRDEIGRLGAAFNAMTDQIEYAYNALRKSHEQTQFALAAARMGVWESDLETCRMRCSASMHLLHHFPDNRLPETCDEFLDFVHKDDRATVRMVLEGSTAGKDDFDIQYRSAGSGGSLHWIEGKGRLVRDADGQPVSVLGVSMDVTDRNRLESQFRQAQKMEAIGQLAGGVAHDFNNLLTAITGHAEQLLMDLDDEAQPREDVNEILKAADSAAKLTRQLLTFSRHQVPRTEIIDPNAVIGDTRQLLSRLIGERITLVTELASDLDPVKMDASQLQQVLMNLAVNARDAMPRGGTLSIASANVELDAEYAAMHATVVPGSYVVMSVSDTGTGMDTATQARLFEPFFTTKPIGMGTGLGLATVYGIVKQGGGHVYVYSEPGHGTTFKVYLPAATQEITAARKAHAPAPRVAAGGETILVVDDNEPVRIVAQTILERLGYHVLSAASGQEALAVLQRTKPAPHLILSDVILPGMTGPELYREVAALYPEIRVIFTSGYSPEAIAPHAELQAGVLFVEKPYNASKLASTVREALGRSVPPAGTPPGGMARVQLSRR